ncbi:hypothetical protein [Oceanirhabdus sp. W0125-5]|uniref:hypothetical protein n=1 Tax=Oceanirhabdus sp. W0125-5 TaxID=2999116 RepID=UPI0022F2E6B6|nr:hypothetical protein [Oceanirhabdus sp. W0125-5]WBW96840.1 hypothetical protein OW730_24590 [Oceanirhabdus sp. W0125-5]
MGKYKIFKDHTSEIIRINIYSGALEEVEELKGKEYEIVNKREESTRVAYYIRFINTEEE